MRCPACNTWMEDDAPVCWMCQHVIDPERASQIDAEAERHRAEALQRRAAARRRRSPLALALITIGVLALFAGGFAIYYYVLSDDGSDTVDEYVAGNVGVEYTSDAGAFTATYPTDPSTESAKLGLGDITDEAGAIVSRPGRGYTFGISWSIIDSPISSDTLSQFPANVADELGGDVEGVAQRDLAFIPATEFTVATDDQTHRFVVFQTDRRLYLVEVASNSAGRAPFEHFVTSLSIDA